jgi:uncharacterized protein YutE (UPF0331/DUF86 family)
LIDISFWQRSPQFESVWSVSAQVTRGTHESLNDPDIQDIFLLNLQRAVQATIDLAAHLVADEKIGLPANLKEHFTLLESRQMIDPSLSKRLQAMVGFRNIAVRGYQQLDLVIFEIPSRASAG